jgi:hypothetical protein
VSLPSATVAADEDDHTQSSGVFMSISRKIAMGASAAALATGCLVAASAGTAVAAPGHAGVASKKCPTAKGHYPPGKCTLSFSKGTYKRPTSPTFITGKVFKPGEAVHEVLKCSHGYKRTLSSAHARSGGAVFDSFHISKKVPKGSCTLTLTGNKSGTVLTGKFTAK